MRCWPLWRRYSDDPEGVERSKTVAPPPSAATGHWLVDPGGSGPSGRQGLHPRLIAERLGVTPWTVYRHLQQGGGVRGRGEWNIVVGDLVWSKAY
jgi:hypothetical protein